MPAVRDYVPLGKLEVGTALHVQGGGEAILVSKTWRQGDFEVFDFEVEGLHNFYVQGEGRDAAGVLVHNSSVPGGPKLGTTVDIDAPGMSVSDGPLPGMTGDKGAGSIYRVPGEATTSGKPYVGRHDGPNPAKDRKSPDGRDRTQAEVIDGYDPSVPGAGAEAEQLQIDLHGGIDNLDNKINAKR